MWVFFFFLNFMKGESGHDPTAVVTGYFPPYIPSPRERDRQFYRQWRGFSDLSIYHLKFSTNKKSVFCPLDKGWFVLTPADLIYLGDGRHWIQVRQFWQRDLWTAFLELWNRTGRITLPFFNMYQSSSKHPAYRFPKPIEDDESSFIMS